MAARKPWSPNEDAYLRQHVGIKSFADIGAALSRSADSVHGRSRKLGLIGIRRGEQHWNAKVDSLKSAMVGALADAGFRPVEIHALLTNRVEISRGAVQDICASRTWR